MISKKMMMNIFGREEITAELVARYNAKAVFEVSDVSDTEFLLAINYYYIERDRLIIKHMKQLGNNFEFARYTSFLEYRASNPHDGASYEFHIAKFGVEIGVSLYNKRNVEKNKKIRVTNDSKIRDFFSKTTVQMMIEQFGVLIGTEKFKYRLLRLREVFKRTLIGPKNTLQFIKACMHDANRRQTEYVANMFAVR